MKVLNQRQARWAQYLGDFNLALVHQPGSTNPADTASRHSDYRPSPEEQTELDNTLRNIIRWGRTQVHEQQGAILATLLAGMQENIETAEKHNLPTDIEPHKNPVLQGDDGQPPNPTLIELIKQHMPTEPKTLIPPAVEPQDWTVQDGLLFYRE